MDSLRSAEKEMKIVQIEDFFHPAAGYQINIISKYFVRFGHEVTILTSKMDKIPDQAKIFWGVEDIEEQDGAYTEKYGVKICRLDIDAFISGRAIFKKSLFAKIAELKPDILFIHNPDSYAGIMILRRIKKGKMSPCVIMDSHMLKMASRNPLSNVFHSWYKRWIAPIAIKNHITVVRLQDDDFVQSELGIPLSQSPWISFGSDMTLFYPQENNKIEFKDNVVKNPESFVVVYAGKLDETKGGLFLAETMKEKFDTEKEIVFVIVGNSSGEYGSKVENLFLESQNKVFRYPTQKYEDLPFFFQIADLVVFPKQCSLSFYDAQACGTPVLSEDNHVNVERCSHENGENFEADNIKSFREKIIKIASMSKDEYARLSNNAYRFVSENYNYEMKSREYEALMSEMMKKKK